MTDSSRADGDEPSVEVRDRPEVGRYEATVDGAVAGVAHYRSGDGTITFTHTVVDPAFRGAGVGSQLARFALDDARRRGLRVRPHCPFIRAYMESHPEYRDLVT